LRSRQADVLKARRGGVHGYICVDEV